MMEQVWRSQSDKIIVCLDSYHRGVPAGCIYTACQEADPFESLSQFLIKMESLLDERNKPQSYTTPRTFLPVPDPLEERDMSLRARKGASATFEIQVVFRQHTSWQGVITWLERNLEQSFRSVLELILLMDSVLRSMEESGAA